MKRQKPFFTKGVCVKFNPPFIQAIDKEAARLGISRAAFIRRATAAALPPAGLDEGEFTDLRQCRLDELLPGNRAAG